MPLALEPAPTPADDVIPFPLVRELGVAQGLHALAVIVPPAPLPPDGLERMLADGVGDMDWLAAHRPLRLDPRGLLPAATRLLCVAMHYDADSAPGSLRSARYAAGSDYHGLLRRKLVHVLHGIERLSGRRWQQRAVVDSAPFCERTVARLAGLGWLGRNALLISPRTGSYRLLGFLLTDAPLELHHGGESAERCGSCRRCERACPTGAIVDGRVLSERCISYLTIEHQGVIPRALAARCSGWWFGCDLCQEVCPWNRFAPPADDPRLRERGGDHEAALMALTVATFDQHFAGRAVRRLGFARFRRNLLVALFSLGRLDAAAVIDDDLPIVQAQRRELGLAHRALAPALPA